ncbi:MAG: branched-chain amino acid ABC transporter permease [Alphaproteobacteria bacterium]
MTRPAALLGVTILVLILLPLGLRSYGVYLLTLWAVFAVAAMGLNLTLGYAGQISLAQAAFLGIGAYVTALMTTHGISFWLSLPASFALCFLVGILLGYPALRVQHHYLAFITLAFNGLVFLVLRNEEWLTGGSEGVEDIPRPKFFGLPSDTPLGYYYLTLGFLVVIALAVWWLVRSPWGRAFAALRENPIRAESIGVDIRVYTLLAFAIGSGIGGLAGSFYAPLVEYVDPTPFTLATSLALLLMVMIGGAGYFLSPFLGAALVTLLPETLRFAQDYYLILYAVAVMLLMAFCPSGLIGLWQRARLRFGPARQERYRSQSR